MDQKAGRFFCRVANQFCHCINLVLKKYEGGRFCTLPHVIKLSSVDYNELFAVLSNEPEIEVLINPFISAWRNEAFEQLEGQIASVKISLVRLSLRNCITY